MVITPTKKAIDALKRNYPYTQTGKQQQNACFAQKPLFSSRRRPEFKKTIHFSPATDVHSAARLEITKFPSHTMSDRHYNSQPDHQ